MSVTTAKWTIDEYHRLVNSGSLDGKAVELLQGEIVQMPPEGPLHSHRICESAEALRQRVPSKYRVRETHPITLEQSEPEPDIALVQNQSYDERHPNANETGLVIEFAQSSLEKDLEEKRLTYAQANIPEYWVVNLRDRHVVVFTQPNQGDYQQRQVITDGIIHAQLGGNIAISADVLTGKGQGTSSEPSTIE